jgi:hypothetical protein
MDLHHVFCLAPHLAKGGTSNNFINSKVEKIFQILSVAAWKQNHPTAKVRMYLNASFLWFRNVELTNAYLFESKRFIESNPASNAAILPNWVYMCFAEQALLADTALFFNKKIETLGDLDSAALNARFSHLWGAKKMILQDKSYENALFDRCLEILKQHYLFFCKHIENFH